jgi:hypothetical protein
MKGYDEMSNRDGPVEIPSVDKAFGLLGKVRDEQDGMAFKAVLQIYRQAPKAETEEQLIAMNIISEAYKIGSILFG